MIGSLTKAFTATTVGELVAEGKMDWDTTPVSLYLPDFVTIDPILTSQLTMQDLLSHRTVRISIAHSGHQRLKNDGTLTIYICYVELPFARHQLVLGERIQARSHQANPVRRDKIKADRLTELP